MGNAKDYQRDRERVIGQLEGKYDQRQEKFAGIFMKRLEADRKKAGMKPAEMWRIFESKGIGEVRAEIDRRLKKNLNQHLALWCGYPSGEGSCCSRLKAPGFR